jgi:hypothetical protein
MYANPGVFGNQSVHGELMSDELQQACFDLARITKWSRKPVDAAKIQAFSEQIAQIAREQVSDPLGIDIPLITRAVRYLANAHATPPMDEEPPRIVEHQVECLRQVKILVVRRDMRDDEQTVRRCADFRVIAHGSLQQPS